MLVDLDYFYAQCEETRNPSIREKPVVVSVYSGRTEDSGVVSTANYLAREYGVRSGIPISVAKNRLRDADAVFLRVDHAFYDEVSRKVMMVLRGYADRFERVGIDEAYLDVTERARGDFATAAEIARSIKKRVHTQVGLTCSIGIGPNRLVAKIAADANKPDGLTVVEPGASQEFLYPLPVGSLIGVGRKTEEKLMALGVSTIGDLAQSSEKMLTGVFGRKLGSYFHEAANGIDNTPVQERGEALSISRISTLRQDTHDLKAIAELSERLCDEIDSRLAEGNLSFRTITAIAIARDLTIHTKSKTLDEPTDRIDVLRGTATQLFEKLLDESELPLRRAGVKVSGLAKIKTLKKRLTDFT
jgi:DNA polymerase IV (DinB-like DNA polymerase)